MDNMDNMDNMNNQNNTENTPETIIEKNGSALNVIPKDRLDTASAPELEEELKPHMEGVRDITFDFSRVEYISSAGLRVLLTFYQQMEDIGGSMKLINVNKHIMAIFNLVNFAEIVTIETT